MSPVPTTIRSVALVLALAPVVAPAQGPIVAGTVRLVDDRGERPAPATWVVLHRLDPRGMGAVDSVQADQAGRFRFALPARPDDSLATLIVSADRHGIGYLSAPIPGQGAVAPVDLELFDTTSAPLPIAVRGRHVIVGTAGAAGRRDVVEVWELANDGTRTRVATPGRPSFEAPLPDGARDLRANGGDVGSAAMRTAEGRLRVFAPISPGLKQLAVRYSLPADAPVRVALGATADVLELLVEDTTAAVQGGGLAPQGAVDVEGRRFARYLARGAPARDTVLVRPTDQAAISPVAMRRLVPLIALGAALLAGLAALGLRRLRP